LAVTVWAQAPGNVQPVVPLRSPFLSPVRAIVQPNAPATTPDSNAGAQKPTANSKAAAGSATAPSDGPIAKPASPDTVKAVSGKRDPFITAVSPASVAAAVCNSGGKRCLAIERINLKGVVRSESGYIAVVVNAANRAFFLRENDPLMNGYVVRITSNAVTFKQTDKDRTGHPVSHDVTLTLGVPAG
jgi:hypothetical protein